MSDIARRFPANPIVKPADVTPTRPGLTVLGVLNPAAFRFDDRTWLLLRVAEGVPADDGHVTAPILDPAAPGGMRFVIVAKGAPGLESDDPRGFVWQGADYLTSVSHLRLASSHDGVSFEVAPLPALEGGGDLERFGIEDPRVSAIAGRFVVAYTAVSADGYGVALAVTADWRAFQPLGMVLAPPNKDCVLFPERMGESFVALHRPVSEDLGGKFIWLASSPDLTHWGGHECLLRTRPGAWDAEKLGAGAPPLRIAEGWLEIYHGVAEDGAYRLGAVLLDPADPARVLGRSRHPIMEPSAPYELEGFYGNVVFGTGALLDGDDITLYYGASDEFVCGATLSVRDILAGLA